MRRHREVRFALALLFSLLGVGSVALAGQSAAPAADTEKWEQLSPAPLARTEVAAARVGGRIYVVGGFESGGVPSRAVESFDPARRRWETVPPLPITLNHVGAVAWDGRLYVIGGYTDLPGRGVGQISRRLFRYDPRTRRWTELAQLPVPRAAFAAGVVADRLYIAGGSTDSEQTTTRVDIYDFRHDRWRPGPPIKVAREHLAGAVAGAPRSRRFYVLGGRDFYGGENYRTVERLNPRTGRWSRLPGMLVPHGGFAAAGVGRRVVVAGGERLGEGLFGTIAAAEVYDPAQRRWNRLPDLPTPRHGLGVAALGNSVYAIEGGPITLVGVSNAVEALRLTRGQK